MKTTQLKVNDIYHNLALEEFLFHSPSLCLPSLFLWQSNSAVVIGKHQNPWRECLVDELKKDSIPIARRITGGGTVFHDMGNLNYAVIIDQEKYDSSMIYNMIFSALQEFGLEAKIKNKSNLCIDGKKFSGNAFAYRKKRVLHHGTLLVNANLAKLKNYLQPHFDNIDTKAIASVPAHVVNLSELNPEITIKSLSEAITKSFKDLFSGEVIKEIENSYSYEYYDSLDSIEARLRSEEWVFGKTPDFTLNIDGKKHLIKNGNFK